MFSSTVRPALDLGCPGLEIRDLGWSEDIIQEEESISIERGLLGLGEGIGRVEVRISHF
jgi:hypothetical protein